MGNKSKATLAKEAAIAERKANQSTSPKQLRARARRAGKIQKENLEKLYKPLDEWDDEELARGRPRAKDGSFKGATPSYISRQVHEEAIRRFQSIIKTGMNVHTIDALNVIKDILDSEETDDNGKPLVSANAKLDAAKFLIEHVVGKPTQHVEQDISVRLQGILGMAMVPANEIPINAQTGNVAGLMHAIETESREVDIDE